MFKTKILLLLFSVLIQGGFAPLLADTPDPVGLIKTVFNNPTQAYQGQMIVSYWTEKESRAEDVKVYFLPPNKYRFEFLSPNGNVDRVVLSNGTYEEIQLIKNNQVSQNFTTDRIPSLLSPQDESDLLLANYKATMRTSENMLGRPTWTVELSPLVMGKPYQLVRIDRATKVILEIKRYLADGTVGSLTRFIQFEPRSNLESQMFLADVSLDAGAQKAGGDYTALTNTENSNEAFLLPTKLYGGFSLEGVNQFEVSGNAVKHCWYTDGLLPVSIFHTPLPVKAPETSKKIVEWSHPLRMGSSASGNIYQWEKDKGYYTLIGDVQPDLLQQIAGNIK